MTAGKAGKETALESTPCMSPRVSFFIQKNPPVEIKEVNSDLGEEILIRRTYSNLVMFTLVF